MQELDTRDKLRRLNTEKKSPGRKASLGSSFGDDESQKSGKEFEDSGIIIKNLVRVNTAADMDYSIANSRLRKESVAGSVCEMASPLSSKQQLPHKGIDFSLAIHAF